MNALVRKEVRLLLPAWGAALALVLSPCLLAGVYEIRVEDAVEILGFAFVTGCLLLGVSGFGREMSARTFSLLLSQPGERAEFWRVKMSVLAAALASVVACLALANALLGVVKVPKELLLGFSLALATTVTGGLWTILLLRSVVAAFWISLLVPAALALFVTSFVEGSLGENITVGLLAVYSVAGYWFARWQFQHAQDTAWTGGNVTLPDATTWMPWRRVKGARSPVPARPWRALFVKEFQLQQVNFFLAGMLLLMQGAVLLVPRLIVLDESPGWKVLVNGFWLLWIVMPLLVGAAAVAEERKLGTLEAQLCLPVSRARQFMIKLLVTLGCGLVLGGAGPVLIACLDGLPGPQFKDALAWVLGCLGVVVAAFYASSLTSQLLQAIETAIGVIVVLGLSIIFLVNLSYNVRPDFTLLGYVPWRGPLVFLIGAGVMGAAAIWHAGRRWRRLLGGLAAALLLVFLVEPMWSLLGMEARTVLYGLLTCAPVLACGPVALLLALAAWNYQNVRTGRPLWTHNLRVWLACVVAALVLTPLVYHRAWEALLRTEPPAGSAVLAGGKAPVLTAQSLDRIFVILPDGRLWSHRHREWPSRREVSESEFLGGSNWVGVVSLSQEMFALKTDGTLWNGTWWEQPNAAGEMEPVHYSNLDREKPYPRQAAKIKLAQVGTDNDWMAIAGHGRAFAAVKRDHTLWGWGMNFSSPPDLMPGQITNALVKLGTNRTWTGVVASSGSIYGIQSDGSVWRYGWQAGARDRRGGYGPFRLNRKVSGLRSALTGVYGDIILDNEGDAWRILNVPQVLMQSTERGRESVIVVYPWNQTRWRALHGGWEFIAGIKEDGSLWRPNRENREPFFPETQLGRRTDWLAVEVHESSVLALARDGTLCRFGSPNPPIEGWLAPSCRVTWSVNVLAAER